MAFIIVPECGVCSTELYDRGELARFDTQEEAQSAADKADSVAHLWAKRCPNPDLHSGPYGDLNTTVKLRVVEVEPATEEPHA